MLRGGNALFVGEVGLPVANVVCVSVVEANADAAVQDTLQVRQEGRVNEIACLLESPVNIIV